jgi:Fe-S-cluster containining protein
VDECVNRRYRPAHIMVQPNSPPSKPVAGQNASARLKLTVGDLAIDTTITVPAAPSPPETVLPTLQNLINTVVDAAEAREAKAGREISCRKGCGACCRQLVPISRTEIRAIRALVARQPEDRRQALQQRFDQAAQKLREAGLADVLLDPAKRKHRPDRELSLAYFAQRIPCPFLEEESCSIHPDRPLVCREYLVTSPASACSDSTQTDVVVVALPKLSLGARGLETQAASSDMLADWLPLALVLEKTPPKQPPSLPGPDWMKRFFAAMQAAGSRDV